MSGQEPRRDGSKVYFEHATGRGVQSIQWSLKESSVEVYADEKTNTKSGVSYLVYQEYGVSAQPMTWLVGKTIPWVLVKGGRLNPQTGTIVQGVTRVRFAGPGSRYAGEAGGVIAETPMVGKEAIDKRVHFTTITQATFSKHSDFNPTGFRWWLPSRPGMHFFREGVMKGIGEAAGHMQGLVFRVAGSSLDVPQEVYTSEYQKMLNDLEQIMKEKQVFPFNQ